MKKQFFAGLALLSAPLLCFGADAGLHLDAGLDIEGDKALYDNGSSDNVDALFGRLYLRPSIENERFAAALNVYFYPEGFGYRVLNAAPGEAAVDEQSVESIDIGKVQIWEAYASIFHKDWTFTFGRRLLFNSNGWFFGNYTDENAGGYFLGKGYFSHCLELSHSYKDVNTLSMTIGSDDVAINTGYLRLFNQLSIASVLSVGVGYRVNLFDRIYDEEAELVHHGALNLAAPLSHGLTPYVEVGFREMGRESDMQIPVVVGLTIEGENIINLIDVEIELVDKSMRLSKEVAQYSVFVKKVAIEDHCDVQAGLYTWGKASQPGFSLKLGAQL